MYRLFDLMVVEMFGLTGVKNMMLKMMLRMMTDSQVVGSIPMKMESIWTIMVQSLTNYEDESLSKIDKQKTVSFLTVF
jgi:hypothetical protein